MQIFQIHFSNKTDGNGQRKKKTAKHIENVGLKIQETCPKNHNNNTKKNGKKQFLLITKKSQKLTKTRLEMT